MFFNTNQFNITKDSISKIRWMIDGNELWVGRFEDRLHLEKLIGSSFGSISFLWSEDDMVLFSKETGRLSYMAISVPDINIETHFQLPIKSSTKGNIQFANSLQNFSIESRTSAYYFVDDDLLLACNVHYPILLGYVLNVVRLSEDFCMIFNDATGDYLGWSLDQPQLYLSDGENIKKNDPSIKKVLVDYFDIIGGREAEEFAKLEIKERIAQKITALAENPNEDIKIIRRCLEEIYNFHCI